MLLLLKKVNFLKEAQLSFVFIGYMYYLLVLLASDLFIDLLVNWLLYKYQGNFEVSFF